MRAQEYLSAVEMFPVRGLDVVSNDSGFVIIAPHPDDETLGCGGLIAEASQCGRPVRVVVITDGTKSHPHSSSYPPPRLRALRESETLTALQILGVDQRHVTFIGLRDGTVSSSGADAEGTARQIVSVASSCSAGALFVTSDNDPDLDHQACHSIARLAVRQLPAVKLYSFLVWGWERPERIVVPDLPPSGFRLDISRSLAAKRIAINAHRSQVSGVIMDDPTASQLSPGMLAHFLRPFECFIET